MILVTGGAGFIGANFVRDWLAQEDEPVVNLDKLAYAGSLASLEGLLHDPRHVFVKGDVADSALLARLLESHRPRAVVHFAAQSHVDRSILHPEDFIQTNVVGTFRLLEAVRAYWLAQDAGAREHFRFLQISTDEVYGSLPPDAAPVDESGAYAPRNPYSASKAAGDHLVRSYHCTYGLPVLTTNCSNNYGPFQFPEKLIPRILLQALEGKPLPIYGDGLQVRDWIHVSDHCRAVRAVLEKGLPGRAYNIGGNCERTNLSVVHEVCRLLDRLSPRGDGAPYARQITHVEDRMGHDRRYALDAGRLREELGWQPLESFEAGLEKTVRWYLAHPGWVAELLGKSAATDVIN